MLDHGGNLAQAVQRYGRAREDWIDLSTGISPYPYPVPSLPEDAWHRLPEPCTALIAAACRYYDARSMLPVAGSQAAIQALPLLRNPARVALALPAYAEHRHHWQRAGHEIVDVPFAQLDRAVDHCDVVVVVNPNNPTGQVVAASTLMQWADRLAARGGWLIVDEAFGDVADGLSVAS
ncbi:aminotransferase class I/II-fold pyridoxal phosphate-dependent enzyme, partial [uncultured Oxalicibacterium sp.]|uniref:aminotransferase class I/II-fold pyridoxal phosphate-dependent enzyme n=1 Tax=uncultured Oxalicibacterium sp. TaxID=1168540 RepID=UPI0025EBAD0B